MKGRLMYAPIMVVKASRLMAFVPTTGCRYYIARRMPLSSGGTELAPEAAFAVVHRSMEAVPPFVQAPVH